MALLIAGLLGAGGCQREQPASALRARFAEHAERFARMPGFARVAGGFERSLRPEDPAEQADALRAAAGALSRRALGLGMRLPAYAGDAAVLTLAGGLEVRIAERGLSGPGALEGNTVAYRRPGGGSFWSAASEQVEEWILTEAAGDGPVAEWDVSGATLRQRGDAVELLDGAGQVRGRVLAPAAWRADGSEARAWLRADGGVLAVFTEARGTALVDPVWQSAGTPLHWHRGGSTTLLPNGKVLLAGGQDNQGEELFDAATGAWTSTGRLLANRYDHSATLLPNGKVLVAGGYAGAYTATAELYDPATEIWSATGSMTDTRYEHSATLLPGGKVLVAGGYGSGGYKATAELYDPATGTWAQTGALGAARYFHTATLLPNGKVLVAGGSGPAGGLFSAELYDPATATWSPAGDMPEARYYHAATLLPNGKILVGAAGSGMAPLFFDYTLGTFSAAPPTLATQAYPFTALLPRGLVLSRDAYGGSSLDAEVFDPTAGWASAGTPSFGFVAVPWSGGDPMIVDLPSGRTLLAGLAYSSATGSIFEAELYDPSMPSLSPSAGPLSTARSRHTVTLLSNGKVLVAGGFDATGNATASAELYDPASGLFTSAGNLTAARGFHTATTLASGKVLLAGGRSGAGGAALASAEVYDPATGVFTPTAGSLSGPRSAHTATLLASGRVFLAGGQDDSGPIATAELFDPAGTFTATGALGAARAQHAAVLMPGGTVRLIGGQGASGPLASVEEYEPVAGSFSAQSTLVTARSAAAATLLPGGAVLLTGGRGASSYLATAEVYPPGLGVSWTLTGSLSAGRASHTATLLPSGKVLVAGGQSAAGASSAAELYDPVSGLWDPPLTLATARYAHAATVLPSGKALLVGGANPATLAGAELLDEGRGAAPSRVPSLASAASPSGASVVAAGNGLALIGATFTGTCEAGPSQPGSSPTNYPLITLERADGGPPWYAPLTAFTSTSATGAVPRTLLPGPYWARVNVSGIPSANALLVRVTPALAITPSPAAVPPRGTVIFTTTGGSGAGVSWSMARDPSGGRIDPSTLQQGAGVYTAGSVGSVSDVVQATDSDGNVATATVAVSGAVAIAPATAAPPPLGSVAFSATGGSGTGWDWTLQTNLSGATLNRTTGAYVAGATGNVTDVVRVTDSLGNVATRSVQVGAVISISPSTSSVYPRGTVTFSAAGGQGSGYAWSLSTNASGGSIDPVSGVYAAGPTGNVYDVVRVTDPLGNVATRTMSVSAGITLSPATWSTTPGGSQSFYASGGSAAGWSWTLLTNGSGGSLTWTAGYYYATYKAGSTGKTTDVIQVTDSLGNKANVSVDVGAGVSVAPATASVQVGGTVSLTASGGTGSYTWIVNQPSPTGGSMPSPGVYKAGSTPGTDVVTVRDGNQSSANATIVVVPTLTVTPPSVTLLTRATQQFTATGGSGQYTWSIAPGSTSGGTVNGTGYYQAGATAGTDTIQVTDSLRNATPATVTVQAPLVISPKVAAVTVNGTLTFHATGGSGTGYAYRIASSTAGGASVLVSTGDYTAGPSPGTDVVEVEDSTGHTDTGSVTVVPVLSVTGAASLPPRGTATFGATGGSGSGYKFELAANNSGGALSTDGRYAAGATGNTTDTIRVTDGAGATATRTVAVTAGVSVQLASQPLPPGGSAAALASGGAGSPYVWTIAANRSGASIDPGTGLYVAGRTGGVADVIQAADALGNVGTQTVNVGPGVTLNPSTATVSPGEQKPFAVAGGSGTGFAWTLRTAGSGAAATVGQNGVYTAGFTGGSVDVIQVTDSLGNVGSATVTINSRLVIQPGNAAVVPLDGLVFVAAGGYGAPFAFSADAQAGGIASGGSISADGHYAAGPVGSVVDHLQVADAQGRVAQVAVQVLAGVTIAPATPVVAPGEALDFAATGGSNAGWTWGPENTVSGGTVDPATGHYVAGSKSGAAGTTDTVWVTDGLRNRAQVLVTVGPTLSVSPSSASVAANGTRAFGAAGGKPPYRWDVLPGGAGGTVVGAGAGATFTPAAGSGGGTSTVRVQDSLGQAATAQVSIAPPLVVTPDAPSVAPRGRIPFSCSGGAGVPWHWSMVSGSGTIDAWTGEYVAGPTGGGIDVVRVTDASGAAVSVTVTITGGISVSPASADVDPGGELTFTASGGSGAGFVWSFVTNASGGTLDADGHYKAGKVGGAVDLVQVTDSLQNRGVAQVRLGRLDLLSCATGGGWGAWSLAALLLLALPRRRRAASGALAAVLALAPNAGVAASATLAPGAPAAPAPAIPAAASAAKTAVLEFSAGPGTDAQIARLATDAMTTVLQAVAGVPIISERDVQTSLSFEKKRKAVGAYSLEGEKDELGIRLGMDVIVYGTVSRLGQTHVLSAQAVDVKRGAVLARFQRRSRALTDESLLELVDAAGELLAPFLPGSKAVLPIGAQLAGGEVPVPDPSPPDRSMARRTPWPTSDGAGTRGVGTPREPSLLLPADAESQAENGFFTAARQATDGKGLLTGLDAGYRASDRWVLAGGVLLGGREWLGGSAGVALRFLSRGWRVRPVVGLRAAGLAGPTPVFGPLASGGAELLLGRFAVSLEVSWLRLVNAPAVTRDSWVLGGASIAWRP